eukprot:scaffold6082_cov62-Attheya_sp.AAC.7
MAPPTKINSRQNNTTRGREKRRIKSPIFPRSSSCSSSSTMVRWGTRAAIMRHDRNPMKPYKMKFHSNPNRSVSHPMPTAPAPQDNAHHIRYRPYIVLFVSPKSSNV